MHKEAPNMHTSLNINNDLLAEAMQLSGRKTKTDTITYALQTLIRQERLQQLKQYGGKIDLGINLDELRGRN